MAFSKTFNDEIWKNIERRGSKEQRELLAWQLQAREPINKFSDIKAGDHLIKKASMLDKKLYYHHFLCIGDDDDGQPRVIHYNNTKANAFRTFRKTCSCASGSTLGQLGIVSEISLPHEDFIKSESELQRKGAEVERVVWPDELKRYPVDEVTETLLYLCQGNLSNSLQRSMYTNRKTCWMHK
jgi:hypothetical protein